MVGQQHENALGRVDSSRLKSKQFHLAFILPANTVKIATKSAVPEQI
jgi:hypothetical protein